MEKEIQMSGEQYVFGGEKPSYLIAELADFLKNIDSGTRVANLFYRIDIDPHKKSDQLPHYEALATLAWNRVFQKVWFRKRYKQYLLAILLPLRHQMTNLLQLLA
jgi:hypothetical protein